MKSTIDHLQETLKLKDLVIQELNGLKSFMDIERINDQFYRRLILRDVYSIVETYISLAKELVKIKLVLDKGSSNITWQELVILNEKRVFLNDKGEIREKEEFQKFDSALRFSLNIFAKEFSSFELDYSDINFQKLLALSKRRNDVTHPKSVKDMFISNQEITDLVSAFAWFMTTHEEINKGFLIWINTITKNQLKYNR